MQYTFLFIGLEQIAIIVKITKKNYRRLTITDMVPHHGRAVEASNLNFILAMFHSWQSSMSLDQVELSGANF